MKRLALLLLTAPLSQAATWIPLQPTNSGTFFNADIVYENDGSPAASTQIGSRYFFEAGLDAPVAGNANGLASSGSYTYATTGATFQLQSYAGNNSSRTTNVGSIVTANFAPGNYDNISFAAAVGNQNGGARLTWTVTYTDATVQTTIIDVEDWGNTSQTNELFNVARTDVINGTFPTVRPDQNYWSSFVYNLDTDPTKTLASITYVTAATGRELPIASGQPGFPGTLPPTTTTGDVHIFGFSGQIIPEPSSTALIAGALGISLLIRRRK